MGRCSDWATWTSRPPYAVRRLGLPEESAEGLIPRHVRHALERRARLVDDPRFCRLVNDDGDGLPGLIVDRYDTHFVIQTLTRAMDARIEELTRAIVEVAGAGSVLLRNDSPRQEAARARRRSGRTCCTAPRPAGAACWSWAPASPWISPTG